MASVSESQPVVHHYHSYVIRGLAAIILILDTEQKLFNVSYISQYKDTIIEKLKEAEYINTSETRLKQAIQRIQKNFKATRIQTTSDQSQSSLNPHITAKEEKYFGKISLDTRIHLRWLYQVLNEEDHTHLEYWACQPEYAVSLQELRLYFKYLKHCKVPVYCGLTTDVRLKLQGLLRGVPSAGKKTHQAWAKRVGVEDVEKVSEYIRHLQDVMNIKTIQRQSPLRDMTTPETLRTHHKTPSPAQEAPRVATSSVKNSRTSLPPTSITRSVAEPQPAESGSRGEGAGQHIFIESRRPRSSDLLNIPRQSGTETEKTSDSHAEPVSAINRPMDSASSSVQQTSPSAPLIQASVEPSIPMTLNSSRTTPSTSDGAKYPPRDTAPTVESVESSSGTSVDRETTAPQVSEIEVCKARTHVARDTNEEVVKKGKAALTQLTNATDDRDEPPVIPEDSFVLLGNHPLRRRDESRRPIRLAAIRTARARRLHGRTSTSTIPTPLTVVTGSPPPRTPTLAVDKNDAQTTDSVVHDAHNAQHRSSSRNTTGEALWVPRAATETAHNTSSHQPPVNTLVDDDIMMAEDEDEDFDGMLEYPKNESEGTSEMEIDELDSDDEQKTYRLTRRQSFNPIRELNRPKSPHPPGLGAEPRSQDTDSTSEARKVFNAGLTIPSRR